MKYPNSNLLTGTKFSGFSIPCALKVGNFIIININNSLATKKKKKPLIFYSS